MTLMREHRFTPTTFLILSGLLLWGAHFLVLYGFAALACARGWASERVWGIQLVPAVSVSLTVIACAALGVIMRRAWHGSKHSARSESDPSAERFMQSVTFALAALGFLAIVWNVLPPLFFAGRCYPTPT